MSNFNCTSCGLCCKSVGNAVNQMQNIEPNYVFPYPILADGSCSMLDSQNKCSVYETRPTICNIKTFYNTYLIGKGISIQDFYNLNAQACNSAIKTAKLDEKYLVQ